MNIEYLYDFNNLDDKSNEQEYKRFKKNYRYKVKINDIHISENSLSLDTKTFNSNFLKQPTNVIVGIVTCFDLFKHNEIYAIPQEVWVIIFSFIFDTSLKIVASIVERSLLCFQQGIQLDFNQLWNEFRKKIRKIETIEHENTLNFQKEPFYRFKNDLMEFLFQKIKKNNISRICKKTKYNIPVSIKPIEKKKINNFFYHSIDFVIENNYK